MSGLAAQDYDMDTSQILVELRRRLMGSDQVDVIVYGALALNNSYR